MSETPGVLPEKLADIVETFKEAQGREKLELLLEFSENLPPLPERFGAQRDRSEHVHECITPVFVFAERNDDGIEFFFDIPPEAPTVRGYAGLLAEGLNGSTPNEVLLVPGDFYLATGLVSVVSNQRINGMTAILAHMKRLALRELGAG